MELCQSRRGELGGHGPSFARTGRTALHAAARRDHLRLLRPLKSRTRGYASLDYEEAGEQEANLVKVDILLQGEAVDAFSAIVWDRAYGNKMTTSEKTHPASAVRGAGPGCHRQKIIASRDIRAIRKDVLPSATAVTSPASASCWRNGRAKKRMKTIRRVDVPGGLRRRIVHRCRRRRQDRGQGTLSATGSRSGGESRCCVRVRHVRAWRLTIRSAAPRAAAVDDCRWSRSFRQVPPGVARPPSSWTPRHPWKGSMCLVGRFATSAYPDQLPQRHLHAGGQPNRATPIAIRDPVQGPRGQRCRVDAGSRFYPSPRRARCSTSSPRSGAESGASTTATYLDVGTARHHFRVRTDSHPDRHSPQR